MITLGYFRRRGLVGVRATRTIASIWHVDVFPEIELCMIGPMEGVNGFVLAGGQSTRMGADKAFVELNGHTLLEQALQTLSAVVSEVRIVGNREKFRAIRDVIEDELPDHGPLGGIHAALRASHEDLNLILAVDMPFVEASFLEYLVEHARAGPAVVTIPRVAGRWQPLCAVYRREFAEVAEPALRAGKNKIDPLFGQVPLQVIEEAEITEHGFALEMFRNVNTPEELSAARLG
jgi:molybdopterin-guanine dinucleotide biosynthesis protein A